MDPLCNHRFRVVWDDRPVAGVNRVSALRRTTTVVTYRDGLSGQTFKLPGRTDFEPITLERGITNDAAFEEWANQVHRLNDPSEVVDYRKDVLIEVRDEGGSLVRVYRVYRCWVSEYRALPDMDAGASEVAIESIRLEHEGWERISS
jgi:phage tail-like protein